MLSPEERCQRMLQRSKPRPDSLGSELGSFLRTHFGPHEKERADMLYDTTMELFYGYYYKNYASDLRKMRSIFTLGLEGVTFGLDEVKFTESMDRFVAKELVFKMCSMHYISDADAHILANHNMPRLVGLYQSLICKVLFFIFFD